MAYLSTDGTLQDSDQHLTGWEYRFVALPPSASYTTIGTFTTAANAQPGTFTLFIKADGHGPTFGNGTNTDSGSVKETNEANNVIALPVTLP